MKLLLALVFGLLFISLIGCSTPVVKKIEASEAERVCSLAGSTYTYFYSTWKERVVGDVVCENGLVIKEHSIKGEN